MKLSRDRLQTYRKLGLGNLIAVAYYRWQLKSGHFEKFLPIQEWAEFDNAVLLPKAAGISVANTPVVVRFFNACSFEQTSPPDWFVNPYLQSRLDNNDSHWSSMPDFNLDTGDVKPVWELSRFDWLIKASWQIRKNGVSPLPVNPWLDSWCVHNAVNQGVNWKCAQEVSIRAMNMVVAHFTLSVELSDANLRFYAFLAEHAKRILPTISYARAQDNNHGTSEAAALFVLGLVLSNSRDKQHNSLAVVAAGKGRKLLEERAQKLIGSDGVFSQYSVNYHRMMLDTLSFAELIRRHFDAPAFSPPFKAKAQLAAHWMLSMVDPVTGDAPNMGTNDGSLLFNLKDSDFRDFRPSCELAGKLFLEQDLFTDNAHGLSEVFSAKLPGNGGNKGEPESAFNTSGSTSKIVLPDITQGFKRIGNASSFAILKVPDDRFRPSQADALHLDVWHEGRNVIRDAGTYSYNPPADFTSDLGDTRYHSTVEIDGRSQMRKLSRFLYTGWLAPMQDVVDNIDKTREFPAIRGSYVDSEGASHSRQVSLEGNKLLIVDEIKGCANNATLRFRLAPGRWRHNELSIESENVLIRVSGNAIISASLNRSVESRYYLELSDVPVFEIDLAGDSVTTTTLYLR